MADSREREEITGAHVTTWLKIANTTQFGRAGIRPIHGFVRHPRRKKHALCKLRDVPARALYCRGNWPAPAAGMPALAAPGVSATGPLLSMITKQIGPGRRTGKRQRQTGHGGRRVDGDRQGHDPQAQQQDLVRRPAKTLAKAEIAHLRHLDPGPLPRRGLRGHFQHHRHELLDLVDLALDHRIDRAAVGGEQGIELQGKPFVDLARADSS